MSDPAERTFPMPSHQRLLVRPSEEENVTPSGILLPPGAHDRAQPIRGVVMHVGPGYRLADGSYAPMDYLPGDVILFFRDPAVEVTVEGESLLLVRDEAVLVVIDGPLYPADVRDRQEHEHG